MKQEPNQPAQDQAAETPPAGAAQLPGPPAQQPEPEPAAGPIVIDEAAAKKILDADFKNLLKKVKRGQPLTGQERKLIDQRRREDTEKRQIVDSIRQAAVIMSRPAATLRAMKRAGCPAFLTGSRVDVTMLEKLWKEWETKIAKAGTAPVGIDEEIKAEKLRKLKLENAELDRQLIDKGAVAERMSGLAARANAILQNRLIIELPPLVAGMDAAGVRAECESIHARICSDFKAFAEEWK